MAFGKRSKVRCLIASPCEQGARLGSALSRARGFGSISLVAAVAAAIGFGALILAGPAFAATSHEFSSEFGGSGTNALNDPTGVAVDNSTGASVGDIYVTDTANHRVEKFSPAGSFILMFGKEVNETKVKGAASEAEQNVCTAASLDTCKPGAPSSASGSFETPTFIAVDNSSGPSAGDVYVGDTGDNLVSKFDEEGALIKTWGSTGQVEGSPTEVFGPLAGIAVDHSGNLLVYGTNERMFRFEASGKFSVTFATLPEYLSYGAPRGVAPAGIAVDPEGNFYKVDTPGAVVKLSETGNLLELPGCHSQWGCVWDGGSENGTGIAIDPRTGDLYVDQGGTSIDHFLSNCPLSQTNYYYSCTPADMFGSSTHLDSAKGLAIDANSEIVYVADTGENQIAVFSPFVLPTISLEEPTNVEPSSVTLNGHIDPGTGAGTEVLNCRFEYGYDTSYGLGALPCSPAPHFTSASNVSVNLSSLSQGARYHYRLVAENSRGEVFQTNDATISTAQEPSFENVTSSDVTATTAILSAKINPNGRETSYHFDFGPTTAYGQSSPQTSVGHGTTAVPIELHLEHLQSGLTYHFRLVAENSEGTNSSEDQTFGFYPSSCPNELLRQESGSGGLPDCRGYELVSPANAGDVILFPSSGPNTGQATDPARLAYAGGWGLVPNSGEPSNSYGDLYVATRTDEGWETKYIGLPSSKNYASGGPPWASGQGMGFPLFWQTGVLANSSLSKIVDWDDGHAPFSGSGYLGEGPGEDSSNAPYIWESTTGKLIDRWPTNLGVVPGGEGFRGETTASSDLSHFVFSSDIEFVPGAASGDVYDDNTVTDEIAVASETETGAGIEGAEPVQVSADGSHILMSVGGGLCTGILQRAPLCGAGQLYMRVNDAVTYEIAAGHVVNYLGMTSDGSKIYFTSNEPLNSEDTNTSTNLYMWNEAEPSKLTLISKANGTTAVGSDSCDATWTEKCDAAPVNVTSQANFYGGRGGNGRSDSFIASENGDIYFYSPAQLDGKKGIEGGRNLYVFRNGQVQFVTTLTTEAIRMDVSPNGSHMAFITTSQVTGYNNGGYQEMYSFDPASGKITCDSCIPDGEPPTSNVYGSQNGLFMTNDGRTLFSTEDALVPQDTNKAEDVYEFVDGRAQLISSGTGGAPFVHEGVIGEQTIPGLIGVSADGTDAYFSTTDVLVGQDLNGQELKIYDARVGGGFPFVNPAPPCAAADECHGPVSSPPTSPGYGAAASLGAGGNARPSSNASRHKKRSQAKVRRKRKHTRRGQSRGSK